MKGLTFERAVGAVLALSSMGAVTFAAIANGNTLALGALIATVSASVGYYLRGKLEAGRE